MAIHNLADGFVLGVGAEVSEITPWLLGLLVHQMPVGISLAAVFVAARASGARVLRTAVLLGLAIPLSVGLTVAFPVPGGGALGFLTGVAGGVLACVGAAHLLPEAQAEHPSKGIGTLVASAARLLVVPDG